MVEQADLDQTDRGEKGFGSTGMNEMGKELGQEKSGQNESEKKKRLIMKEVGPKKGFLTVEEREKEVLFGVAPEQREKLREIIEDYRDVFPNTLPKGRPPRRDIVHEINTEPGAEPVS